ncbi:DNA cytosine methyltransferase [Leptospira biflexa]|uniref:DNA cytosine methyltransferase n=1 Tax=Leptospira biflexa TaxID=172 RepID=UPI001090CFED|nr:DNA cytosine methyltransferase [Leptospira biflexa]TGM57463.1 DNA cytosine methyltransferase [Leptospira biflexa]
MSKCKVLDLFSGCGGLSLGFKKADFEVIAGLDNDPIALETFKYNHVSAKAYCSDISVIDIKNFLKTANLGNIDLIIGGPPCQGFSISGKRDILDERNGLFKPYLRFVQLLKPKAFILENVPNFISMGNGLYKSQLISLFNSIGYEVKFKILNSSEYGVPQSRRRVFFVGIKGKLNSFEFPIPTHGKNLRDFITTREAISDLPEESILDGKEYVSSPLSNYQKTIREGSKFVYNHQITKHSENTLRIISLVPDGGNYKDLPQKFQNIRNVNIAWTRYSSAKPSLTIDTGHRHHFHYEFNRVPTVRESARLQSFPDTFIFKGAKTHQYRQVGNAVPPILGFEIAKSIKEQIF